MSAAIAAVTAPWMSDYVETITRSANSEVVNLCAAQSAAGFRMPDGGRQDREHALRLRRFAAGDTFPRGVLVPKEADRGAHHIHRMAVLRSPGQHGHRRTVEPMERSLALRDGCRLGIVGGSPCQSRQATRSNEQRSARS
ncbi:hypothetical protein [Gordonia oryzae]|uniref:hypothetical protein n=1 Tax=Gordonia oryzae TaxID=2487349 RepID=UPI000F4FCE4E|nr:hypothetical protein [Gordonia oryzae]